MISFRLSKTLSSYLTLYYALAFALILSVTFTVLYGSISAVINNRIDEDLLEDIEEMSSLLESADLERIKQEIDYEAQEQDGQSVFLLLYNKNIELVYASSDYSWAGFSPDKEKILQQLSGVKEPELETLDLESREEESRVIYGALSREYVMVLGESLEERDEIMELLMLAILAIFLVAIPLASLLVWFLTRRAVRGIEAVSEAARDISRGDLSRRVSVQNNLLEVQSLADTFDSMAERIQTLIKNMREMTDNMAHDLRSPLGRVRVLAESVLLKNTTKEEYRSAAEHTISECDRLIKMINTSLDVAETEAGVASVHMELLELHTLVEDACELFDPLAEQNHIQLSTSIQSHCQIEGDKNSLQRMLSNLIDNAIKFTPEGGTISVKLNCDTDKVVIRISDTGIGIPKEDLPFVFNRFYRCDQSRTENGCGLGLSYAKAVVRAHGGCIRLDSSPTTGSVFSVELPRELQNQFVQVTSPSIV